METVERLRRAVRDIPDFPKKGIIFKDITPILQDRDLFRMSIDVFAERYHGKEIEKVVGIEARGFLFASALAYRIGAGVVPVRKPGKLPFLTERASYQLEYGEDCVEIHRDGISPGERVLVVDDLLATGGTMLATLSLVERLGGKIYETAFLIELGFLKGRERLRGREIFTVLKF